MDKIINILATHYGIPDPVWTYNYTKYILLMVIAVIIITMTVDRINTILKRQHWLKTITDKNIFVQTAKDCMDTKNMDEKTKQSYTVMSVILFITIILLILLFVLKKICISKGMNADAINETEIWTLLSTLFQK